MPPAPVFLIRFDTIEFRGASNICDRFLYKISQYLVSRYQPAFTCSKVTIETLEQGVKYVQS